MPGLIQTGAGFSWHHCKAVGPSGVAVFGAGSGRAELLLGAELVSRCDWPAGTPGHDEPSWCTGSQPGRRGRLATTSRAGALVLCLVFTAADVNKQTLLCVVLIES